MRQNSVERFLEKRSRSLFFVSNFKTFSDISFDLTKFVHLVYWVIIVTYYNNILRLNMFDKEQISRGFNWWLGKQLSVLFWNIAKTCVFIALFVILLWLSK